MVTSKVITQADFWFKREKRRPQVNRLFRKCFIFKNTPFLIKEPVYIKGKIISEDIG